MGMKNQQYVSLCTYTSFFLRRHLFFLFVVFQSTPTLVRVVAGRGVVQIAAGGANTALLTGIGCA